MASGSRRVAWLGAALLLASLHEARAGTAGRELAVRRPTTEHAERPLGVDEPRPRFSWELVSRQPDAVQTSYRIQVATVAARARLAGAEVWDSGVVLSDRSVDVVYAGPPLAPATRYYWSVHVVDSHGHAVQGPTTWFETGLGADADWSGAEWIAEKDPILALRQDEPIALAPGHSLGQSFTAARAFSSVAAWFASLPDQYPGLQLSLYESGPGGTLLAKASFASLPADGLARLDLDTAAPAGSYYLEATGPLGPLAWWSTAQDLLAGGEPYADGAPVAGERSIEVGSNAGPAPLLRTQFGVASPVRSARLYVCGLGYAVVSLNGTRVGDRVLDPAPTVFHRRALYSSYDVTHQIRLGDNAIGVELGRGFYSIDLPISFWAQAPWRASPRLRLLLVLQLEDGTRQTVISDPSWRMAEGPTLRDSVYLGETYDARLAQPGFDEPSFDASAWRPALVVEAPTQQLVSQQAEPIRVVETIAASSIASPRPGSFVFRFPRMIAGWPRLEVAAPAGSELVLRAGESLAADGSVSQQGDPQLTPGEIQTWRYIAAGSGVERFEPRFGYAGFQYVQLDGFPGVPTLASVVARSVRSDVRPAGQFASSDPLLDAIRELARASVANNLHGIPTDTPTFEKRGWLGDAHLYTAQGIDEFGLQRLLAQWLDDVAASQAPDGAIDDLVPAAIGVGRDPAWGSGFLIVPWRLYQEYGDREILARHYEAMRRYVDHLTSTAVLGIVAGQLGDVNAPGATETESYSLPPEGPELVATAYYWKAVALLAEIAGVLGHDADASVYGARADEVREAFHTRFFDPATDSYRTPIEAGYRQTSNAIPLALGLTPADRIAAVVATLVADVRARGNHLDTGIFGTAALLPVLTQHGEVDLAYAVATQTTFPSWGHWIADGATTAYENWTVSPRSRDHAMFGSVDDWIYSWLVGIRAAEPGFRRIRIEPRPPRTLDSAEAARHTPRGWVSAGWSREPGGRLRIRVRIPANATGEIVVPGDLASVTYLGVQPAGGMAPIETTPDGRPVYAVGSGLHQFAVAPPAAPRTRLQSRKRRVRSP